MTPPPDARESALDELLDDDGWDMDLFGDLLRSARAELSALRASQGAVAREKAALADDIRARIARFGDVDACYCNYWLGRYDALRPAATGEAISADDLRDAFIEGWHASAEELDEPYDAKKALAAWAESASKHDARAAIARAEGRKGTDAT